MDESIETVDKLDDTDRQAVVLTVQTFALCLLQQEQMMRDFSKGMDTNDAHNVSNSCAKNEQSIF